MHIDDSPVKNLTIICNGCGQRMRDWGIWPIQFPKADGLINYHHMHCYGCNTCATPHEQVVKGIPVQISIMLEG
jgi:hypothetical protein